MKIILISINQWALSYLKDSFNKNNYQNITLITDKLTKDLKIFLIDKNINYIVTDKLNLEVIDKLELRDTLVLSAGSPWIFTKEIINKFGNNFYNVHQSPLPSMKGSVSSYVILYEIRSFQVCLHKVNSGIDTGKIVYRKNIFIPSSLKTPKEVNNFLQSMNRKMVKEFLLNLEKKIPIKEEIQNNFFSSYNIRLHSNINGWIDWDYKVEDLDRFIRSFGEPYDGAKTFIHNKKVNIKYVEFSRLDAAKHPDEIGRVLRKFEDYIIVTVNNGSIYIKEIFWRNKNIISNIKSGDKFYTKYRYLDLKNRRVNFVKSDKKIYNKKINLKEI